MLGYYGEIWGDGTYPWCADFVNYILKTAELVHTESLLARSFLEIGEATDAPKLGDLVVLWRISQDSKFGHVGLFISQNEENIFILGGNQDGIVKIKSYPKWQLLGYRRLDDKNS